MVVGSCQLSTSCRFKKGFGLYRYLLSLAGLQVVSSDGSTVRSGHGRSNQNSDTTEEVPCRDTTNGKERKFKSNRESKVRE